MEYQSYGNYTNAPFGEFEMRLCHTPLSTLTNSFQQNYGGHTPVLVYAANPLHITATQNQWFGFDCSPVFNYDNQYNLIIEVRWRNQSIQTEVDCWAWDSGANRLLIYKDYNATQGDLGTKLNRFRIIFDDSAVHASTLGRIKALYR